MVVALGLQGAYAGEVELQVERGRVALEREAYAVARDRAIEALGTAPDHGAAQQLYVDATAAGGLGSRGLLELVTFEAGTVPWQAELAELERSVAAGEWRVIRSATEQL